MAGLFRAEAGLHRFSNSNQSSRLEPFSFDPTMIEFSGRELSSHNLHNLHDLHNVDLSKQELNLHNPHNLRDVDLFERKINLHNPHRRVRQSA